MAFSFPTNFRTMTLGVAVEQILLNVNGGVLSADSSVQRVDILPYFAAAVNEVIGEVADQEFVKTLQARRAGIIFEKGFDYAMYFTYTVSIKNKHGKPTAPLSVRPAVIGGKMRYTVEPCEGSAGYIRITHPQTLIGIESVLSSNVMYWHEQDNEGFRIVFSGGLQEGTNVRVQMICSAEQIPSDAEIPVPDDRLKTAIDRATQYFLQQRFGPGDYQTDNVDQKQQNGRR